MENLASVKQQHLCSEELLNAHDTVHKIPVQCVILVGTRSADKEESPSYLQWEGTTPKYLSCIWLENMLYLDMRCRKLLLTFVLETGF